jgi:predicted Zn-dependent protease
MGHTLGLTHCANHGCLMADGKGSVLTTDDEYDLCDKRCRPLLEKAGYMLGRRGGRTLAEAEVGLSCRAR